MSIKQISVFLENKPGSLYAMTGVLARHQIDMRAMTVAEASDFGIVRFIADDVYKVHAICVKCGHLANYSYRLVDNDKRVLLGEKNEYQPLCRRCYLQEIQERKERAHEG